jgi:hypothetical protein
VVTKSRIVGLLLILFVGFLVLRPGDDPSDSGDRDSESATDRQFQSREPAFLAPERDYGIAGRPGAGAAPRPYGAPPPYSEPPRYDVRGSYPPEPYAQESFTQDYPVGYGARAPYGGHARPSTGGYRFRPLDEQERRRTQKTYSDRYPTPYYPAPLARPEPVAPAPYSAGTAYPEPAEEIYSFRPLERSARGRWQGPYQDPGWRTDRGPTDPWSAPPPPQWGSMPPAQRMYPNLHRDFGRRMTSR